MRRTVATLLAVASPLLLATPVEAGNDHPTSGNAQPAVAAALPAPAGAVPAGPVPESANPSTPAPVAIAPPAITPAPALGPAPTPASVRHTGKPVRAKGRAAAARLSDSAYTAKLQVELCAARQIFCGLASNGRYPTR